MMRMTGSSARRIIESHCARMKEGERLTVACRLFLEAYPCGWPSIYDTPEQTFLSSKIGSAWGVWRVSVNPENGNRTISKHAEGERRVYVDPDRQHYFRRIFDGSPEGYLVPREDPAE